MHWAVTFLPPKSTLGPGGPTLHLRLGCHARPFETKEMERKAASMERSASGANLQKQRCYCNRIISQIKKTYKKIVWIIRLSLRRRHRQIHTWLGKDRLVFSGEYG